MRRTCALAVAVLLGTAGCSGSDDDGTAAPPAPITSATTSTAPSAANGTVDLRALAGNRWSQGSLSLKAGDTVVVTNADPDVAHYFVASGVGRSETLQPGDTFRLTFPKAGTFDFVCTFHPGMEGEVTVS